MKVPLTAEQKRALFLAILGGDSVATVSKNSGLSLNQVRSTYCKMARQMLHPVRLDEVPPEGINHGISGARGTKNQEFWRRRLEKFPLKDDEAETPAG